MQQFSTRFFRYNGISSDKFGIIMCELESNVDNEKINGIQRNTNEIDSIDGLKIISSIENLYQDIDVILAKVDRMNNVIPYTTDEIFKINDWLFNVDEYKPLEIDEYFVNSIFTKGSSWRTNANKGYLNVTLHCEPYARGYKINQAIFVDKVIDFELDNKNNVGKLTDIDFEIYLEDDATEIEISNMSNGTSIRLEGLTRNCEKQLKYYGNLNYIESLVDNKQNILQKTTVRNWIKLLNGNNIMQIKSDGNAKVIFRYQPKIQYM